MTVSAGIAQALLLLKLPHDLIVFAGVVPGNIPVTNTVLKFQLV